VLSLEDIDTKRAELAASGAEVTRIGDDRVIPVDVRVLATSNKNPLDEVKAGWFREDLYYRLCVLE